MVQCSSIPNVILLYAQEDQKKSSAIVGLSPLKEMSYVFFIIKVTHDYQKKLKIADQ